MDTCHPVSGEAGKIKTQERSTEKHCRALELANSMSASLASVSSFVKVRFFLSRH